MNYKNPYFWGVVLCVFLYLQSSSAFAIINGGFEVYDFNESLDFNTPTGWQQENYTVVFQHFIPNPDQGSTMNWLIDVTVGLFPFEGQSFLVLSTGDLPRNEPNYAKVWQTIEIEAGNKLTGAYFFGVCDYYDWNDFAEIKLVPKNDPCLSTISVVYNSLPDVGSYGSFPNWKRFEYIFDANQAGTYDLVLFVGDYRDFALNTYLVVDGLVLCEADAGFGDFNADCEVNFEDFAIFATDWLCDCDDLAIYNAPNHNCLLGTDLTDDGLVDSEDLGVISESWLGSSVKCENYVDLGDFNGDCKVNFEDFVLFAADWLCDCDDPVIFNDPGHNCTLGTDLTGDGPVDTNDLGVLSEFWLDGTEG